MQAHLEITTALATKGKPCPNSCVLCPQDTLKAAYLGPETHFSLESLKRALATVPKSVQIHFSGFAEPFFNHETPEMIQWVKGQGWPIHLYTTLMGMPPDIADRIPREIETVCIHVPDQRQFTTNEDAWMLRHEIWRKLGIECRYMAMNPVSGKINRYLSELGHYVHLPAMRSRAGNLWKIKKLDGPMICGEDRLHSNVLLPNGDVQLCCDMYDLSAKIGNLFLQPYHEIWGLAEKWRLEMNPPENSRCRTCEHGICL